MENVSALTSSWAEAIFGKPIEKISCADVKTLVETRASESLWLEFKAPTQHINRNNLKMVVLKSIIGFLNSDVGEGTLILGIKGKEHAEELVCIPRELLGRNRDEAESRLRNWIFSNLSSIPPMILPPRLTIRVFDCSECGLGKADGWISVIYVKRTFDALYYSKIDDTAYRRRSSETKKLSLEEAYYLINAKRQPIVIILMMPTKVEKNKVVLKIKKYNNGSKPAYNVTSALHIYKRAFLGKYQQDLSLYNYTEATLKNILSMNISKIREDNEIVAFQINTIPPSTLPVFPGIHMEAGEIQFTLDKELYSDISLMINFTVITLTDLNMVVQECFLVLNASKSFNQVCKFIKAQDYTGRTIFEISIKDGRYFIYDEKGTRIEKIK